jgi:hypothetical protein
MGIDFLQRTSRSFDRSCQKGYEDLRRTRLFDPSVNVTERSFLARMKEDADAAGATGDVVLRIDGPGIGVYRDERQIGVGESPPETIVQKIKAADQGLAIGRIEHVHPFSGTADIAVL